MKLNLLEMLGIAECEVFEINWIEYKFINGETFTFTDGEWRKVFYPIHLLHGAEFKKAGGKVD